MITSILWGLGFVFAGIILYWIYETVKAIKDPDVQAASNLRMNITRFKKYQRFYDEYSDYMIKHGVNSSATEKKFVEIFKQIDNPNEWKRYQSYRDEKDRNERYAEIIK